MMPNRHTKPRKIVFHNKSKIDGWLDIKKGRCNEDSVLSSKENPFQTKVPKLATELERSEAISCLRI